MTVNDVVGVDPSLTATGIATSAGVTVVKVKAKGMQRLDEIAMSVDDATTRDRFSEALPHVFIEGYAYGRHNQAHQLGELGGVIRHGLWTRSIAYTDVPPSVLKKFATGKGNAGKPDMLDAARRAGYEDSNDDNAVDAWWLRQFGLAVLTEQGADTITGVELFAYRLAAVAKFEAVAS